MRDDGAESAGPQTVNQGARFSLGRQLRNWVPQSFFGGKNGRAKGVSDAQAAGDEMAVDNPGERHERPLPPVWLICVIFFIFHLPRPYFCPFAHKSGFPKGTSAFPIRSLTDAHVPRLSLVPIRQSPAWLTFASLASRGGDLAPHHAGHAAPPHATAGHIQWATEGGPLPDSMSRHTGGTIAYSQSPTGKANEGPPSKESLDYMQLPALDRGIQDSVLSREHSPKTHFEIPRKVRWPCVSSRCPQAMRDASVPWSASRIRKLFQIGKGFMSEVFHAVDTASGLQVALKVYDKARVRTDTPRDDLWAPHAPLLQMTPGRAWAPFRRWRRFREVGK